MPNISLTCVRYEGDNADKDIINPLFTDTSIMRERARVLFNEQESNRIISSNLCPLKPFILPTSLVNIRNFDDEIQEGLLFSGNININISNTDISMSSEFNIERLLT